MYQSEGSEANTELTAVDVETESRKMSAIKIENGDRKMSRANAAFQPAYSRDEDDENCCCNFIVVTLSYFLLIITFPLTIWGCFKIVTEYERAVIFRLGRLKKGGAAGPGLFFINPFIDTYKAVDLRSIAFDVPPQEVLTRDSVTVSVDAVVFFQVVNPLSAICNNEDYARSTRLLSATTLRNVLGTRNLSEILSEREEIADSMHQMLEVATDPWGVHVDRVEIKDVRLPQNLQRSMAAEAEAAREARAKVIAAEGEQKSSRALKGAADLIQESPMALQLRYLQTLSAISAEKNSTIIFPLPMELLEGYNKGGVRRRKTNTIAEEEE